LFVLFVLEKLDRGTTQFDSETRNWAHPAAFFQRPSFYLLTGEGGWGRRLGADFQDLSPRGFHNHSPTIFMIMHPPFSPSFTHRFHDHAPTRFFTFSF
jgi:hypothetical protein